MIDAGINGFGLMAFLKSLDRKNMLRFAEVLRSPTEECGDKVWRVYLARDDSTPLRVRVKPSYKLEFGMVGTIIGPPVEVCGVTWAAVHWDDEDEPDWFKTNGLEPLPEEPDD